MTLKPRPADTDRERIAARPPIGIALAQRMGPMRVQRRAEQQRRCESQTREAKEASEKRRECRRWWRGGASGECESFEPNCER